MLLPSNKSEEAAAVDGELYELPLLTDPMDGLLYESELLLDELPKELPTLADGAL